MAVGTVKWFNAYKGYGFIAPKEGGSDVFVHVSAVERATLSNLREGVKVSYQLTVGRNGKKQADNLRLGCACPDDPPNYSSDDGWCELSAHQ